MSWLESQIDVRTRLDKQALERAYASLATSVTDPHERPRLLSNELEQVDGAIKTVLRYNGVESGEVPDDVDDLDERIEYLCRPSGIMRRKVRLDDNWQKKASGAYLGKLDSGETIAILPSKIRGYHYYEPGTKRKVRITDEVAQHIEAEATYFYRPLPPRKLTTRDLVQYCFSIFDLSDYVVVFLAALFATLIGLLPAWANQIAFGVVVPSGQSSLILPIGALLLGVAFSTILIGIARDLVTQRVSIKVSRSTEAATFARVLSLPSSFFREYPAGNLSMRMSQVSMLTQLLFGVLMGAVLTCALSVIYLIQIGVYAHDLVFPAFVIIFIQAALVASTAFAKARYERETMKANAEVSGITTGLLNGIQKIKLAGAEDRAFAQWALRYSEYAHSAYHRPFFVVTALPLVTVTGLLGTIAIYFYAGSAHLTVADFMSFNVAFGQMSGAVLALANIAPQAAQIQPMLEMVEPIMEATPEISPDKPSIDALSGEIEVSNVSFRYKEGAPYILKDLSFKVKPGEYVALVGKSGCGKSTIMRLLLGFEKAEFGSIFYGPYDVQKVDLRSLRHSIGSVMQDGKLFMGDIASNITISTPNANIDDAWEAAELAGIADDIRKMPMGMQTIISEGSGGISGGQRQRLMIARAICGNRKILMFDEATSALDNKTQKHVSDSLDALKCTRVVIAHRLSTVRHCDRILVVDDGHIVEEGTYDELLAKEGIFAELVKKQRLDAEL